MLKGVCEECGSFDELVLYEDHDFDSGEVDSLYVCTDCYDEMAERDHNIYDDD